MSLSWPRSCSVAGRIETLLLLSCMRVSRSPRTKSIGPPQGRSGARRARMGNVDQVALEGMSFRGRHGVRPAEREQAQEFKVDIEVDADLSEPGRTDRLEDTIDYTQLRAIAKETIEGDSVKLLETLAARAARASSSKPGAASSGRCLICEAPSLRLAYRMRSAVRP